MKKKMPSEGLRLGRDSGSIICDTLKKWRFRTGWGRGAVKQSSSFLFDYLCILNIIIVMYHRSLRTTTGKLEPVD